MLNKAYFGGVFTFTGYTKNGNLKFYERGHNLIVNDGLNHILNVIMNGGTQILTWYVGLKNSGTISASDTMASHAGWTENSSYSEATRLEYVEATSTSQLISNSANVATFTFSADGLTIAGAFLSSGSVKGGTTGTLLNAMDFASPRSFDTGDILNVRYDLSASDDGV